MAAKLDRSKPYGIIMGDSKGRKFVQGGHFFDALEEPIVEEAGVEETKEEKKADTTGIGAAAKPQKKDPATAQIEKQLNG